MQPWCRGQHAHRFGVVARSTSLTTGPIVPPCRRQFILQHELHLITQNLSHARSLPGAKRLSSVKYGEVAAYSRQPRYASHLRPIRKQHLQYMSQPPDRDRLARCVRLPSSASLSTTLEQHCLRMYQQQLPLVNMYNSIIPRVFIAHKTNHRHFNLPLCCSYHEIYTCASQRLPAALQLHRFTHTHIHTLPNRCR